MKAKRDGVVEIGGHQYALRYVKGLKDSDGERSLCEHYKPDTAEILIEADQPMPSIRNTLIHEIVHGIMEHGGWGGHPDDERIASAIAYGLESVKVNGRKLLR